MSDNMMTQAQFYEVAQRMMLDELQALVAAGHLTEPGLRAVWCRLGSPEFDPTPQRDLLALNVEAALGWRRHQPDDLSELDEPPQPRQSRDW